MQSRIQNLKFKIIAGIAALAVLLGLLFILSIDPADPPRLALLVGRLHPLIVHLPIGFLILAAVLEYLSRRPRFAEVRPAVPYALVLSALGAVGAVVAGYLLSMEGYAGSTLDLHKWLGIGVAVFTVAACAFWFFRNARPSPLLERAYTGTLLSALSLLAVASHLGGTMTHGEDYLTEHAPEPVRLALAALSGAAGKQQLVNSNEAVIYRDLVRPVLEARCVACHGPDKQKGDLRLDSREAIQKGGENGPVLVSGRAVSSEMLKRVWLPADHADVMPPRGKQPLSPSEAEILRWWVDQGASFEQRLADVEVPGPLRPAVEDVVGPLRDGQPAILAVKAPPADPNAIRQAEAVGFTIVPLADGTPFLHAHTTNVRTPLTDGQVRALAPLARQITWLDLSGMQVSDATLETLSGFPHLSRLRLDRTHITDAGLRHLAGMEHLEYLNLFGTEITDAGLGHLVGLKNLRTLYLWQTDVTPQGLEQLTGQLPRLQAHLGTAPPDTTSAPVIPASTGE